MTHRYIQLESNPRALIVRFVEQDLFGEMVAECTKMEIMQAVDENHPSRVIIDFTDVRSISSSMIGALLTVRNRYQRDGIELRLCCVPVPIQEVYRTLNLQGTKFQVDDTLEQSLNAATIIEIESEQMED